VREAARAYADREAAARDESERMAS
jgi:hypothetical protein